MTSTQRPKILIYLSKGGFAHRAASEAISSYLKDGYTPVVVSAFEEVLKDHDPVRKLSGNRITSDGLYNWLLARQHLFLLYLLVSLGPWFYTFQRRRISALFLAHAQKEKPRLLISTIPLLNFALQDVSQALKIPLIIVSTDWDFSLFIYKLKAVGSQPIKILVPVLEDALQLLKKQKVFEPQQLSSVGYPLRESFLSTPSENQRASAKKTLKISYDQPTVLIMMGGQGGSRLIDYCKILSQSKTPLNILVCAGLSEVSKQETAKIIPFHHQSRILTFGYLEAQQVTELMRASDFIVTKSGGNTIAEALSQKLFLLLDRNSAWLPWEKYNRDWACRSGFAEIVVPDSSLLELLDRRRANPPQNEAVYPSWDKTKQDFIHVVDEFVRLGGR